MGVIASANVTLVDMTDVSSCAPYYLAQSAQAQPPLKPTTNPPTGWSTTEPAYDASKVVYVCWLTEYSNGEFSYSDVSLMSSYTGANEAWNKADNAQTVANNANDKAVAFRGTCSTGATAQAKSATCTNFSLTQGATVTIYNTTAQTYANNRITLNVNGTGDKEVHVNGAATSATNQLLWTAGSIITFTYNGTYWYVADEPGTFYATCTTASDYSVKSTSTPSTAVIRQGTKISILMSNANSANTPELNVASTGAKYIYAGGTTLSSNSLYNWQAGSTQSFTFDGGVWRMDDDTAKANAAAAAKSATDYITNITSAGVFVHADGMVDSEDITAYDAYGVHIDQDIDIIRGGEVVATYGEDVTIGIADRSRAIVTPTSFSLINGDNDEEYVFFGDMRGNDGVAELVETISGGYSSYRLRAPAESIDSVYFSIPTYKGEKYFSIPTYKGEKSSISELPTTGNGVGDIWSVEDEEKEYIWDGDGWIERDPESELPTTGNEVGDIWYVEVEGQEYIWDGSDWDEHDPEDGHPYRRILVPPNGYSYTYTDAPYLTFSSLVDADVSIEITYSTTSPVEFYTFGSRNPNAVNGFDSFSIGSLNTASGNNSFASGLETIASGSRAHAEGNDTTASGDNSHAEGSHTTASGDNSHAEGGDTEASGFKSHAEGNNTTASGSSSHSEGSHTTASGNASHAEGNNTTASGNASHAEGWETIASHSMSHAEGKAATASGYASHAEGGDTEASSTYSHAEGCQTTASNASSHAEGRNTTASGNASHAEGWLTTASYTGAHAEGYNTTASDYSTHAEGYSTIASLTAAHAEGYQAAASGYYSHAEGVRTTASGYGSHAEGMDTVASSTSSHAQNAYTIAASASQTAMGRYNIADTDNIYALIIGNGTSPSGTPLRSNCFGFRWNGDIEFDLGTESGLDEALNDYGWFKEVIAIYYKGVKDTVGELPATGNTVGDEWFVPLEVGGTMGYMYVWLGSAWEKKIW